MMAVELFLSNVVNNSWQKRAQMCEKGLLCMYISICKFFSGDRTKERVSLVLGKSRAEIH
jgi:hypothetical protein